ncbi:MAG: ABC transporter substrate-binding protein [Gemmatimonadaceae bacterium]|nr:ABC transporter substrate-binding protein [Gemmatimonadaceae bacterium]
MANLGPIVSLLPAATEMIVALGAWERLAGVTHECDYPDAVRRLPRVTSSALDSTVSAAAVDAAVREAAAESRPLFTLDEATIRALQPTVIVTQGLCEVCAVSDAEVRRLAASLPSPARVVSLGARTFDAVLDSMLELAAVLGRDGATGEAYLGLQVRIRRVHETLKAARAPRPRVVVLEWTDPVYAAGHWVPDMVRRAGGIDVLGAPGEHSRARSVDEVRAAAPDLLLIAPCGYSLPRAVVEARELLARPAWEWARGLRLTAIDGNALTSRPGPRVVDGVEVMARLFHPDLFTPIAPGRGTVVSLV